jgi:hypothetical protein
MTMMLREYDLEERPGWSPIVPSLGAGEPRLDTARLQARGADAIDRALSRDSAAWLIANRQEGGQ